MGPNDLTEQLEGSRQHAEAVRVAREDADMRVTECVRCGRGMGGYGGVTLCTRCERADARARVRLRRARRKAAASG